MTPACKKSDYQAAPRYQGSDVLTGPLFQWQNVCHPNGQKSTEKINISPKYPNAEDLVPELLLKAFPLPVALNQLLFSQKHSDKKIHLWEAFLSTSEQRISAAVGRPPLAHSCLSGHFGAAGPRLGPTWCKRAKPTGSRSQTAEGRAVAKHAAFDEMFYISVYIFSFNSPTLHR